MIHLTHINGDGKRMEFDLPIPLKTLLKEVVPGFWSNEKINVSFETPFAEINESLNRCFSVATPSELKVLSLLAYMLERMDDQQMEFMCRALPKNPCDLPEIICLAKYYCDIYFLTDGTLNPYVVPIETFQSNYEPFEINSQLIGEFKMHIKRQRLTGGQFFEKIVERARLNGDMGRFENIHEYVSPNEFKKAKLCNYNFDFLSIVNFGGSEGIYIDCMLKGQFDESDNSTLEVGTIKTLETDLGACKIMGELCGVLMYYSDRFVDENFYLFTPYKEIKDRILQINGNKHFAATEQISVTDNCTKMDGQTM